MQSLPIWSGKFSKNTEMWNSELRTMGKWEWKDQGEMRAGKALQAEAGLDQGTEERRELSWGAVWWQFIQVINLDRVPAGHLVLKRWKHHESMSSGVQEGFLEEEASQLTPERQLELEEKHRGGQKE